VESANRSCPVSLGSRSPHCAERQIRSERKQCEADHSFGGSLQACRTVGLLGFQSEPPDKDDGSNGVDDRVYTEAEQRQASARQRRLDRERTDGAAPGNAQGRQLQRLAKVESAGVHGNDHHFHGCVTRSVSPRLLCGTGGRWADRPGSSRRSGWPEIGPIRAPCRGRCRGTAACPDRRPRGR
jgi:hypothetical protein